MFQYAEIHHFNLLHKQTQRKKKHIISLNAEKSFDKNLTPLHDKSLGKIRYSRPITEHIKSNMQWRET